MIRVPALLLALVLSSCATPESRRERLEQEAFDLLAAYERFDANDLDGCIAICNGILKDSPELTVAKELREDAASVRFRQKHARLLSGRWFCWN